MAAHNRDQYQNPSLEDDDLIDPDDGTDMSPKASKYLAC